MENPFPYSNTNKRYHTHNYALRRQFDQKVCKVSLNAGFTCPNIDGSKGLGGCTYCSDFGSGEFGGNPTDTFPNQFEQVRVLISQKWPTAKYIAYLQAHSNTYGSIEMLRECYDAALAIKGVVGLSIATRADCISAQIVDLLAEYHARTYLTVELGLQSTFDETSIRINRCHSYADFLSAAALLRARNIRVCVHLINGLPGETTEMMLENARRIGQLDLQEIKLHLLHILHGTSLAAAYKQQPFPLLTQEQYTDIICNQLEVLPQKMVIQRLTGDGDRKQLVGPLWSLHKRLVLNSIDKELVRRNSFQGKYWKRHVV